MHQPDAFKSKVSFETILVLSTKIAASHPSSEGKWKYLERFKISWEKQCGPQDLILYFYFFLKTELMTWEFLSHWHFVENFFFGGEKKKVTLWKHSLAVITVLQSALYLCLLLLQHALACCFAFFSELRVAEILKLGRPYFNCNSDIHLKQNLKTVI